MKHYFIRKRDKQTTAECGNYTHGINWDGIVVWTSDLIKGEVSRIPGQVGCGRQELLAKRRVGVKEENSFHVKRHISAVMKLIESRI